jgi:hypothetical protein
MKEDLFMFSLSLCCLVTFEEISESHDKCRSEWH